MQTKTGTMSMLNAIHPTLLIGLNMQIAIQEFPDNI